MKNGHNMLNPEDIKYLANEYAEFTDGSPADKAYIRAIAQCFSEWLLKDFCIVSKNDIKRYYNVDKCTIRDHRKRCGDKAQTRAAARIRLCESLFGIDLFKEK